MASSYLPWLKKTTPLLLQAYLGSSLVIEDYSFIETIFFNEDMFVGLYHPTSITHAR
jgi:hypothetical protein